MWTQILFRSIALFILVLVLARILGKRNITRINKAIDLNNI